MLGLQGNLALQKAVEETKDGAVKELLASGAHVDLQDDQVIQKGSKKHRYKRTKEKTAPFKALKQNKSRSGAL